MSVRQLNVRDAADHDRAAVRALCRASLLPEDTSDEHGLERLLWASQHAPVHRVVATEGADLIGFIAGTTSAEAADQSGYVTLIAVRPDRRRRGVGLALVEALESRLGSAGMTEIWTGGSQPNYWWPGVDRQYQPARDLFLRVGYVHAEDVVNMSVDLSSDLVDERTVDGVAIRRLASADFPRFQAWMRSSWDEVWDRELELTLSRDPVSCFVAEENGDYIGFAAYDTNRVGWFGPMGSARQARGRGVGAALLRLCLRDSYLRGDRQFQIAWAGPQKFYRDAVAARPGRRFDRLRKVLPA